MKFIKFLITGILFGIIMTKSEAVSWYRIQEMFRFDSFHMYGIIGSALISGILGTWLIKKNGIKTVEGSYILFKDKELSVSRYLGGGIVFGLGWALSGACPGPMFTLLGGGYSVMLVLLLSATVGTFTYGLLRDKLPH